MAASIGDLEYFLQHESGDSPDLTAALAGVFYRDLFILAFARVNDPASAQNLAEDLLRKIITDLPGYPTGTPLRVWVLKVAVRELRKRTRWIWSRWSGSTTAPAEKQPTAGAHSYPDGLPPADFLGDLQFYARLLVLLRHRLGIAAEDMAQVLGRRPGKVIQRLERDLSSLMGFSPSDERTIATAGNGRQGIPHRQARWLILQRGNLGEEEATKLESHLMVCQDCQDFDRKVSNLEEKLAILLPEPQLSASEFSRLCENVEKKGASSGPAGRFSHAAREVTLVLAAVVLFLAVGWIFNRLNPLSEVASPPSEPLTPTPLAVLRASPRRTVPIRLSRSNVSGTSSQMESSWDPVISSDGNWIAFSSSIRRLVDDDTNDANDIFVMAWKTGEMERISVNSDGGQANNSSYEPSISGDGRWVAFTSWANNLTPNDRLACEFWSGQSSCPDIFVHDRQTGETILISRDAEGLPVNNFSYGPVISSDGEWVVFWSAASDLVEEDEPDCGSGPQLHSCLDIFARHLPSGSIQRLPVGRDFNDPGQAVNQTALSISRGGRWIVFMLNSNDLLAAEIQLANASDYFIYDRDTREISPVNLNSEGEAGNESSYAAVISQDGRWLAFASEATNLVPDDRNGYIDIFVRDRLLGTVDRISMGIQGQESDGDSGITAGRDGWLSDGLAISADGRWVMYVSVATNLVEREGSQACDMGFSSRCHNIYLHDRETGETRKLNPANVGFIPFTTLSDDAQYATFMADSISCNPNTFCADIYLYERETNHVAPMGNYGIVYEPGQPSVRRYEDRIVLDLHETWVTSLAFSPNGELLASGSRDRTVALYHVVQDRLVNRLENHPDEVVSLAFSPDGGTLAVGLSGEAVYLWRVPQGTLQGVLNGQATVQDLAFSPDGNRLAVAAGRGIQFWDLDSGEMVQHWDFGQPVRRLAYSPRGGIIAMALGDNTIWIRSLADGKDLMRLGGHNNRINDLEFSPNGVYLASAADDQRANLWRLIRTGNGRWGGEFTYSLLHEDWVTSVSFTKDGRYLATGSFDNSVGLWEVRRGRLISVPFETNQNQVLSVAFSGGAAPFAAGTVGGEVHLWSELDGLGS